MIVPVQKDLFAVIGNPVAHSLSPAMMNAAFESLGVPAVYLALQVDDPAEDLETLAHMGFKGLSVTLPHKEAACRVATDVDETAMAIGAVNTLKLQGRSRWEGRNTDWLGAMRALEGVVRLEGKHALVLGAGGVSRALVYGLKQSGVRVIIANRGIERGKSLAAAFGCDFIPLADLERSGSGHDYDLVVQCTPAGMMGSGITSLVADTFFHSGMVAMDTVYRPLWTPFLLSARRAGCTLVSGMEMLLHQGVAQLEWWLGQTIPRREGVEVMRDTLTKALSNETTR